MPVILPVEEKHPQFGSNCFIAPNATIVGDVILGNNCSIWFNAVVRGDVNYIRIGHTVNIQDGAAIHCTFQRFGTTIGNNVSIGHNAIVHGCTLHDNVLIGMGAIVMDGAVVHSNTIIAAGAIVLEGMVCEAGSIYAGVPAKKVKNIPEDKISGEIHRIANNYVRYADWFRESEPKSEVRESGVGSLESGVWKDENFTCFQNTHAGRDWIINPLQLTAIWST